MPKLVEMDEHVTFAQQLNCEAGPIILINVFTVATEEGEQFLQAWTADAGYMMLQPGFISAQLHRGVGGSGVFVNYAVWESIEDLKRAFYNPDFQSGLRHYPLSTVASPHLFQKVVVPGICADR